MSENKISTYMLYAIGEIILVVVGILIAVSIDGWNEERKTKIKSNIYMQRLGEDIEVILVDVENSLKHTERNLKNSIIVQESLESGELPLNRKGDFDEYISRYYQFNITIQDANTFNEMLSAGELNLIENRWIREAFSDLSGNRDFITEVNRTFHLATIQNSDQFDTYVRYHFENFETDSARSVPSYDFKVMSADASLINMISRQSKSWNGILNMYRRHYSDILQLKDSIQSELNKFN